MGRFESPFQIATLFIGAVFASAFVIFLLRLEATKRYGGAHETSSMGIQLRKSPRESSLSEIRMLSRKKRSAKNIEVDDSGGGWPNFQAAVMDPVVKKMEDIKGTITEKAVTDNDDNDEDSSSKYASDLSESLLTEALGHHKIRHVMDKISQLKRDDQVVAGIMDRFCQIPQDVGPHLSQLVDLVHELQNSKTSTSAPATTRKSTALPSTSGHPTHNTNDLGLHHLPPAMVMRKDNLGMRNQPHHNHHPYEDVCKSQGETLVIVAITTFVNLLFVGAIIACRGCLCNQYNKRERGSTDRERLVEEQDEVNPHCYECQIPSQDECHESCCQSQPIYNTANVEFHHPALAQQKMAAEAFLSRLDMSGSSPHIYPLEPHPLRSDEDNQISTPSKNVPLRVPITV